MAVVETLPVSVGDGSKKNDGDVPTSGVLVDRSTTKLLDEFFSFRWT